MEETFGVEFSSSEEVCHYSDYRNLASLEGHRYKMVVVVVMIILVAVIILVVVDVMVVTVVVGSEVLICPSGTSRLRTRCWG